MAVSYVSHGTASATAPTIPAGLATGDLMLLFIESDDTDGTVATPTGWTAFASAPAAQATTTTRLTIFYKLYAADSAPSITNPGNHIWGVIAGFTGNSRGSPFNVIGSPLNNSAFGNGLSLPAITTDQDGCMVVMASARSDDATAAHYSNWTNANLGSVTEQYDAGTATANGGGLGIATGTKATAGSCGASTFDGASGGTGTYCGIQFAINPALLTKALGGTVTPTGTLAKLAKLAFAGAITPVGALTAVGFKSLIVGGVITPTGDLVRKTFKGLDGVITPVGTLAKLITKPFDGSITPTGSLSKLFQKTLGGTITPTGDLVKGLLLFITLGGSITPVGDLVVRWRHQFLYQFDQVTGSITAFVRDTLGLTPKTDDTTTLTSLPASGDTLTGTPSTDATLNLDAVEEEG